MSRHRRRWLTRRRRRHQRWWRWWRRWRTELRLLCCYRLCCLPCSLLLLCGRLADSLGVRVTHGARKLLGNALLPAVVPQADSSRRRQPSVTHLIMESCFFARVPRGAGGGGVEGGIFRCMLVVGVVRARRGVAEACQPPSRDADKALNA